MNQKMTDAPYSDDELEPFNDKKIDGLEFCRMVYALFDKICREPDGEHVLRERRGAVKKLVEELLPICRYVQTFYGAGQYLSVRWVNGNQSFDAKIEARGLMIDHLMWPQISTIEVTQAMHANEHLMRELLNTKGGGFGLDGLTPGKGKRNSRQIESVPTSYTNQSYIADMCTIIFGAIQAKIVKLEDGDYPEGTTLIVDCSLTTVFLPAEWEQLIEMLTRIVPKNNFERIFLIADSGRYSTTL